MTVMHKVEWLRGDEATSLYEQFGRNPKDGPIRGQEVGEFEFWWKFSSYAPTAIEYLSDTREMAHYLHDGTGIAVKFDYGQKSVTYTTVWLCEHTWDEEQAIHTRRGYHRDVCSKCGYERIYDSGD